MRKLKQKSIKDAIHGYIQIDEPFWRIIDTAEFQRLKWVEQTSYRVLYPSARHDRFIHSIGVYHLGQKAIEGFIKNSSEDNIDIIHKYSNSFLIGCLLHDIGHAPFSHTCEDLYNYQQKVSNIDSAINRELLSELSKKLAPEKFGIFVEDYKYTLSPKGKSPAEHEIMSAIISCRKFAEFCSYFDECDQKILDLDLVVRSIIGCCYASVPNDTAEVNIEKGIKNCLIRLLNSETVDVDKLDYIARDTRMSGYDNIVLDTERLLDSICMICNNNVYYPSFKKSALSVISNVFTAKNLQARWIINHPVVIYESYILRRAIGESLKNTTLNVNEQKLSGDELIRFIFSSKSLSKEGNSHSCGSINLLSDIELLSLMKQQISIKSVSEFFARKERKRPIWKSHEEFLFCLDADENKAAEVSVFVAPLINYLNRIEDLSYTKQIDESLYKEISSDDDLEGKEELLKVLDVLKEYKLDDGSVVDLNYVILPAKNSFFANMDSKNIYIRYNDSPDGYNTYYALEKKEESTPKQGYKFFYLYSNNKLNAKHFLNYLYNSAHSNNKIRM